MEQIKQTLKKITDWLDSEEKDLEAGAILLLKLNKNQILYRNVIHKKNIEKIEYELKKQKEIYEGRLNYGKVQDLSEDELKALKKGEAKALTTLKQDENEKTRKGKRADHDQLSEDEKRAYEDNQEHYKRMRSVHEKLKLLTTTCDRYPYVQELIKLDTAVGSNWEIYDNAVAGKVGTPLAPKREALTANQVSAARKYLSDNKSKLEKLKLEENTKGYDALKEKMQKRLFDLILDSQEMDEKHLQELLDLGLVKPDLPTDDSDKGE